MNKMSNSFNILFAIILLTLFNQQTGRTQSPGGIPQPIIWKTDFQHHDYSQQGQGLFNYHSYEYFDEDQTSNEIELPDLDRITLFMVYNNHTPDVLAKVITKKGEVDIHKDKVFSDYKVPLSCQDSQQKFLRFSKYFYGKKKDDSKDPKLIIGRVSEHQNNLNGGVAELIVYDRLLSEDEKVQIESYLSIKYGLSLPEDEDYFDSKNQIIFSSEENEPYIHNVTALGRDDESDFNLTRSHNLRSDFDLTIGLLDAQGRRRSTFNSGEYIFFSDNGESPILIPDKNQNSMLRKWKVCPIGNPNIKQLTFSIPFSKVDGFEKNKPLLLVIDDNEELDKSRHHVFNLNSTGDTLTTVIDFEDYCCSEFYFSFVQRQYAFFELAIDTLSCTKDNPIAELHVDKTLVGSFELYKEEKRIEIDPDGENILLHEYGEYQFISKSNRTERKTFWVTHEQCPHTNSLTVTPNPVQVGTDFTIQFDYGVPVDLHLMTNEGVTVKTVRNLRDHSIHKLGMPGAYIVQITGEGVNEIFKLIAN